MKKIIEWRETKKSRLKYQKQLADSQKTKIIGIQNIKKKEILSIKNNNQRKALITRFTDDSEIFEVGEGFKPLTHDLWPHTFLSPALNKPTSTIICTRNNLKLGEYPVHLSIDPDNQATRKFKWLRYTPRFQL